MISRLRLWLGLALSVVCLAAVVRGIDPAAVAAALVGVDYLWLVPAVLLVPLTVWLKTMRWALLFRPHTGLRVSKLFSILMIGYLINSVFPARLGDPARAFLAHEIEGVRTAHALATVIVERLLDVLMLLVFLVLLLPFIALPDWVSQSAGIVGLLSIVGFVGLFLVGRHRDRLLPHIERLAARLPRVPASTVSAQIGYLLSGFDAFATWRTCVAIAGWSFLVWAFAALQNYVVLLAFGAPAPASAAVLVLVVNALGMLVPSSPGYVGVFHYLTVITLAIYGVDRNVALSYAILLHILTFLPLVLMGFLFMSRESLSLGRVSSRAANMER